MDRRDFMKTMGVAGGAVAGAPALLGGLAGEARAIATPACGTRLERPDDTDALQAAIAEWLDRIEGEGCDRAAVRAAADVPDERACLEAVRSYLPEEAAAATDRS